LKYDTGAVVQYEKLRSEHEALRAKYAEVILAGGHAKADHMEEKAALHAENEGLHRQCDDNARRLAVVCAETNRLQVRATFLISAHYIVGKMQNVALRNLHC